ncbi:putative magnesium chelatase [Actinoplanes missouriensis 431]|uniref:Putative magnesium chelatase n=1 Tax=Actinoplanes missouriensis (strain ATCC 14538 / DSM 43046 / CBS 188.64 / JCM 3121 / NBRC 102363 / NCIMB 12654 / NRRL B-3342 / UNCC 431) TaxID=512565 RepID=I0HGU4_ACTM4|nr:YifB family Mg chelatase-like AAA ATPase [Actinoplanes missouriensis]BAL92231.1 putative magnesium chelatase [Actinoplanes missouriensis 431]
MSYARVLCAGLVGVTGHLVEVEADLSNGLPALVLTGLPDTALHEARDRVRAAVLNSGREWPNRRITVNLLPAGLPKHGSGFDLAIAAALLAGAGELPPARLAGVALLGELGLDGTVRPVRGVLPMVAAAARAGVTRVIVPLDNAHEASVVPGVTVRAVESLHRLVDFVQGNAPLLDPPPAVPSPPQRQPDLADVSGMQTARYALEIAAAGGHHLALIGPPGAGKTMLAERLPSILPELDDDAALEVTALQSIAGILPVGGGLVRRPPFQAPHHSASMASLIGGGPGLARPGAMSLAHQGVLFLDEVPEIARSTLQALRQPLESGRVVLARTRGTTEYPARVQLVAAANPCPCATAAGDQHCICPATARRRYLGKLSGPLLDRIDIKVTVQPLRAVQLTDLSVPAESSAVVADRVVRARENARARWAQAGWRLNTEVPGPALRRRPWGLPPPDTALLRAALDRGALSARGFDRVLRLAWTIADLDGRDRPAKSDVAEAFQMRMGDISDSDRPATPNGDHDDDEP